ADVRRIVEVAHVFRDRERPYRRVDAMAQADRDLILGLEQPRQIGVLVREHARAYVVLSDDIGLLADAVFVAEDGGGHDLRPVGRRQDAAPGAHRGRAQVSRDRKSTRLNSSHEWISYAVFCLKKKTTQ